MDAHIGLFGVIIYPFFFLTKEAVWCGSALISVFRLFLIFRAPNGTENDKFPDLYRTASEWSG